MDAESAKPNRAAWLKGGEVHCNIAPIVPARPRRIVLLGAPGVGKGTQAGLLASRLGTCHLATGEVFRDAQKRPESDRTPTLIFALEHIRTGELVPDEIMLNLIIERTRCLRCKGGFILDDYPRTLLQAEALDKLLTCEDLRLDAVINYELSVKTIIARLAGRRVCAGCHAVFHATTRPPKKRGVCDHCGAALEKRADDQPGGIQLRMQEYLKKTAPLIDLYRRKEIFISLDARGTPEEVFEHTLAALQELEN